jgi:Mce-associated membrane protein
MAIDAAEPVAVAGGAVPASSNRGLKLAVAALAALSFALAIVAAMVSASNKDSGREAAVRRTAGAFGTAILTYDYKHVDAWKRNVTNLSTGVFKKQFESYSKSLGTIFVTTKNSSDVRDIEIFLNDVSDKSATAIVVVDTTTSGTASKGRAVTAYLQLDLVKSGNAWLVDGLTNLNLGASAPAATATTSTTTATRR